MMRNTTILGAIALVGLVAGPTFADSVTIVKDNTDVENIKDYSNVTTSGSEMAGLTATVTYVGGATSTYTYLVTGAESGAAAGGNFSIGVTGPDTYPGKGGPWTLTNTATPAVVDVKLDGFPGDTVFDSFNPDPGTFGSPGSNFAVSSDTSTHAIVVTYSGEVSLAGAPPKGDVYRYLDINFGANPFTGKLVFTQDTDNTVTPPLTGVPEPAPMLIMGIGVMMMGGLIARKRLGLKA